MLFLILKALQSSDTSKVVALSVKAISLYKVETIVLTEGPLIAPVAATFILTTLRAGVTVSKMTAHFFYLVTNLSWWFWSAAKVPIIVVTDADAKVVGS